MDVLNVKTLTEEEAEKYNRAVASRLNCSSEEFFEKYAAYKQAEADFMAVYEPFKESMVELYEQIEDMPKIIVIGGVKITYVSPSVRNTIDTKKLKEEEPELAKKFTKTTNVKATMRIDGI